MKAFVNCGKIRLCTESLQLCINNYWGPERCEGLFSCMDCFLSDMLSF